MERFMKSTLIKKEKLISFYNILIQLYLFKFIMDSDFELILKTILIGPSPSGKSVLISQFVKGMAPEVSHPTLGVEF